MFLKCLFSLRSPVRCCDWKKYAVELISCKTHQDFLLTVLYFISHLNIEACLEVNKAQWFMNLPNITHQSILPWLCTGTQSTLQMQNYQSWLCLHLVQPIHPYIQCHSWHTDVHSLRMHKVLDLLQLVYLKIDKKIRTFKFSNFCELTLHMKKYQPCWKEIQVSTWEMLRNATHGSFGAFSLSHIWSLQL